MTVPRTARVAMLSIACVWAPAAVCTITMAAGEDSAALREYYSGNGLLNRGMYELAVGEYRRFLEAHPDHDKAALARYGLAVSLFRMEEFTSAVEQLEALGSPDGFEYQAEALMITGQSRLAL